MIRKHFSSVDHMPNNHVFKLGLSNMFTLTHTHVGNTFQNISDGKHLVPKDMFQQTQLLFPLLQEVHI